MSLTKWNATQTQLESEQRVLNRSFEMGKEALHVLSQPQGVASYKSYEDASFVAGDSPATLDVVGDLGRKGQDGSIACDGAGSILVAIDGGDNITIKKDESFRLTWLEFSTIVITHSGTDSSYRVVVG